MKNKKLIILVVLLFIAAGSVAVIYFNKPSTEIDSQAVVVEQAPEKIEISAFENLKIYFNEIYNWSVYLPSDWQGFYLGSAVEQAPSPEFASPTKCHETEDICYSLTINRRTGKFESTDPSSKEISLNNGNKAFLTQTKINKSQTQNARFEGRLIIIIAADNYFEMSISEIYPKTVSTIDSDNLKNLDLILKIANTLHYSKPPSLEAVESEIHKSPTGKISLEIKKFDTGFSNKFEIQFSTNQSDQAFRSFVGYFDIKSVKVFLNRMEWGPGEELVLLPYDEWGGDPGTKIKKVISLNLEHKWEIAEWNSISTYWLDSNAIVGNQTDSCINNVALFDGEIGQVTLVKETVHNLGWEVEKMVKEGALIRAVANDCAIGKIDLSECYLLTRSRELKKDNRCTRK